VHRRRAGFSRAGIPRRGPALTGQLATAIAPQVTHASDLTEQHVLRRGHPCSTVRDGWRRVKGARSET
jgi:hypothetical protein